MAAQPVLRCGGSSGEAMKGSEAEVVVEVASGSAVAQGPSMEGSLEG
jgi:hypothetical protein